MAHKRTFYAVLATLLVVGMFLTFYGKKYFGLQKNLSVSSSFMADTSLVLKEIKSPAGYPIWLAPADIPVVTVGITFLGAGQRCSYKTPGLVELLISMLDEGAGPYNSQAFKTQLLEKNIQLSMTANQDNIVVTFRTPKSNVKSAFDLLHYVLTAPRFETSDMVRVKQQLGSSWEQSLHYPEPVGQEAMQTFMLGENHPYSLKTTQRIDSLPHITADELRQYMRKHFTQSSVRVVVAGDIAENELIEYIDKTFCDLTNKSDPSPTKSTSFQNLGKIQRIEMDVPQSALYFAQPSFNRHDPDFYAWVIVSRILGNTFKSRLWDEVREKRGLAYFCSTNLVSNDLVEALTGTTATKTETVQETIDIIKEEWQKLADHGITEEELQFHKKNALGSYALNFGSTAEIVSVLLGYCQLGFPLSAVNERNKKIYALTVQDVNRVIRQYLKPNELVFVVVGRSAPKPPYKS